MTPRLVKTEADYEAALARVDELMSARVGTPEADELDLWVHLVEEYENRHHPMPPPDPVEAIRFRMDQQGLKPADLVPLIGSRSKVSEVLSRKRPLSLAMIRRLHADLGIPAEVLLQGSQVRPSPALDGIDWRRFPLTEMTRRGWFRNAVASPRDLLQRAEEILGPYLMPEGLPYAQQARLRQKVRTGSTVDDCALWAWQARVWHLAQEHPAGAYDPGTVDARFIGEVARLSVLDDGPVVAREVLAKAGVRLVCERQLPHTHLDGAAIRCPDGTPIVALTLRYDRLDNFWFTLCHELAHLVLHLREDGIQAFMDDLEAKDRNQQELDADRFAAEALIPSDQWEAFRGRRAVTQAGVHAFARSLRLHPAIIAGRWRKETGNYRVFPSLIGHGQVRKALLA
jgi:HTH-type transcriptional regulator / antitoxin HigA